MDRAKTWSPRPPEKRYLLQRYGLTQPEWWQMFRNQGGVCAICRKSGKKLFVDHLHVMEDAGMLRGSVRGLLCWLCNSGLAHWRDNADNMQRAADYLRNPPAWQVLAADRGD